MIPTRIIKLSLWFALLVSSATQASIVITDPQDKVTGFQLGYFYDASRTLTVDDIVSQSFENIPSSFALGYRDGTAWFKLVVTNISDEEKYILSFSEVFWSELDLYEYSNDEWHIQKNGLNVPVNERSVKFAVPAYSIHIRPYATKTYYLKGQTVSSHIGSFSIYSEEEFFRPGRMTPTEMFNIYSGVLIFIMLLVGFLYFTVRERVYIYYIFYVLAFLSWISVQSGLYLNLGLPGWKDALHALGTLVVFFLILFSKQLLQLDRYFPKVKNLFNYFAIIVLICGIAITLDIPFASQVFNVLSSLFFILLLTITIQCIRQGYFKEARYYLFALVIYTPSMALMSLTYNSVLPNISITRYAFTLGSFIEILFFSFILVSKYAEEKYRRQETDSLLDHERSCYQQQLSREVQARTQELEETKEKLSIEARTDTLSGLLNRRYFLKEAEMVFVDALKTSNTLSILMMDIDRFKGINDNFGHKSGDDVIRYCADIFSEVATENTIVARYGGEEFIMLVPGMDGASAMKMAEDVRARVEGGSVPFKDEKSIHVTLSVGVAEIELTRDDKLEAVLQRADQALYEAKDYGRNHVILAQSEYK